MRTLRRFVQSVRYDLLCLGINLAVPPMAVALVTAGLCVLAGGGGVDSRIVTAAFEYFLAPMAAWWSVFLLVPILGTPGGELFLTFPASYFYYGFTRVFRMWCLYAALAVTGALVFGGAAALDTRGLALQAALQSLFFSGLGFLAVTLTRSSDLSITIVAGYTLLYAMVFSYLPSFGDIFLHRGQLLPLSDVVGMLLLPALLLAVFAWGTAQFLLSKTIDWQKIPRS